MPIKLPSYLYRNRYGIFYFRITQPADLRTQFGYRETRISLRTPDRVVAVSVARHLTLRLEGHWRALRQMDEKDLESSKPSPLLALLKETQRRLRAETKADDAERALDEERDKFKTDLYTAKKAAVTAGYLRGLKVGHERAGGAPAAAKKAFPLFLQVTADLTRFKHAKTSWQPRTIEENRAIYDLFIEINGDQTSKRVGDLCDRYKPLKAVDITPETQVRYENALDVCVETSGRNRQIDAEDSGPQEMRQRLVYPHRLEFQVGQPGPPRGNPPAPSLPDPVHPCLLEPHSTGNLAFITNQMGHSDYSMWVKVYGRWIDSESPRELELWEGMQNMTKNVSNLPHKIAA